MKQLLFGVIAGLALGSSAVYAQITDQPAVADYLGAANPQRDSRPLIGLRRKADFVALQLSFISDSRDSATRTQEIHAMLLGAIEKASGAGLELATGNPVVTAVTKDNYKTIPLQWAGREDTGKADVLIKMAYSDNATEIDRRIGAFVNGLARKGRGTIQISTGRQLILRNPEQYRATIIKLIADDAKRAAEAFGPDYRAAIDGLDKPIAWSQVNNSEVFLYVPYTYRIAAK